MIALLFALLSVAMLLAWRNRRSASIAVFLLTIALSIYWLDFHSTTPLSVQL